MTLVNPLQGENLEDLHCELECQRSARESAALLNSVQGENLEDLRVVLQHQELECQLSA